MSFPVLKALPRGGLELKPQYDLTRLSPDPASRAGPTEALGDFHRWQYVLWSSDCLFAVSLDSEMLSASRLPVHTVLPSSQRSAITALARSFHIVGASKAQTPAIQAQGTVSFGVLSAEAMVVTASSRRCNSRRKVVTGPCRAHTPICAHMPPSSTSRAQRTPARSATLGSDSACMLLEMASERALNPEIRAGPRLSLCSDYGSQTPDHLAGQEQLAGLPQS